MVTKLLCGFDPLQEFPDIPTEADFEASDTEYMQSEGLKKIGSLIIKEKLTYLGPVSVDYFWKAKGGTSGGNRRLGQARKPTALLKKYCPVSAVVWVAADHARELKLTRFQMEALLFHELLHLDYGPDGLSIRAHDFEGFGMELTEYGTWNTGLQVAEQATAKPDA